MRPPRWCFFLALATACRPVAPPLPQPGLAADVAYLGSPALAGRGAGSRGGDSAAAFIARQYESLGLRGAFPVACDSTSECPRSFYQSFSLDGMTAQNVAVVVPGSDSASRDEYVIVGAHYDHLGRSSYGALDTELGDVIRPGADDNASGTAVVLELGRRLAARPPRRSVLLVHFDAEELGLLGSRLFVERPPVALRSMVLMVNLDMVGRLGGRPLTVDAAEMPRQARALVDSVMAGTGLRVIRSSAVASRTDHASFRQRGVPAVSLFTGFHGDYHKASDVVARLDIPGMLRVADVAEQLIRAFGDRVDASTGKR